MVGILYYPHYSLYHPISLERERGSGHHGCVHTTIIVVVRLIVVFTKLDVNSVLYAYPVSLIGCVAPT